MEQREGAQRELEERARAIRAKSPPGSPGRCTRRRSAVVPSQRAALPARGAPRSSLPARGPPRAALSTRGPPRARPSPLGPPRAARAVLPVRPHARPASSTSSPAPGHLTFAREPLRRLSSHRLSARPAWRRRGARGAGVAVAKGVVLLAGGGPDAGPRRRRARDPPPLRLGRLPTPITIHPPSPTQPPPPPAHPPTAPPHPRSTSTPAPLSPLPPHTPRPPPSVPRSTLHWAEGERTPACASPLETALGRRRRRPGQRRWRRRRPRLRQRQRLLALWLRQLLRLLRGVGPGGGGESQPPIEKHDSLPKTSLPVSVLGTRPSAG